ncbi:MAG: hypothetical protein U5R48_11215 [Gammaproteobacteria bacterium]|nr:hypothetical protein [Gammaproteobacteria bacterium]
MSSRSTSRSRCFSHSSPPPPCFRRHRQLRGVCPGSRPAGQSGPCARGDRRRGVALRRSAEEQNSATGLNMALIDHAAGGHGHHAGNDGRHQRQFRLRGHRYGPGVQRSGFGFGFEQIVMRGIFNGTHRVNNILLGNDLTSDRRPTLPSGSRSSVVPPRSSTE